MAQVPALAAQPRSGLAGDAMFSNGFKVASKEPGSNPNTGKKPSGFGNLGPNFGANLGGNPGLPSMGKENAVGNNLPSLPSLHQPSSQLGADSRKGSGTGSGRGPGSRYKRMARYQPGQMQMPPLPSANKPNMGLGGAPSQLGALGGNLGGGMGGGGFGGPLPGNDLPAIGGGGHHLGGGFGAGQHRSNFGAHAARMMG